jgi:tetratricopeptide (TPR) repeat protein
MGEDSSLWIWFQYGCLTDLFFWWVVLIVAVVVSRPFIRIFQTWQAKQRFIRSQGVQLRNPQNAEVRFQLAHIYAQGGRWGCALEYVRESVRVAAENPLYEGQVPYHFLRLLGDALYHTRRYGEAREGYRKALEAKSDLGHAEARFGLGKSLYRLGEVARALDCFREVLRENESNLEAYFRLAQAAARLGKADEADSARAEFRRVASSLPLFAGRNRFRWRLAFLLFPFTRWWA